MARVRRLVSFDWALKKLLRSKANFGVLEGFLTELLGEKITICEILESESNRGSRNDKQNRLDLKARNHRGEFIIIEVQYDFQLDYLQRILYSTAKTVTEHMAAGRPYGEVAKVISVSILYFDLGHGEDYVYHGTTCFRGIHHHDELELSRKQFDAYGKHLPQDLFPEYYLIKGNSFDDVARNTLDEWIYFLKHEEIKDSFKAQGLQEARDRLDVMKLSEKDRRAFEQYADDLHYQASMFESSYGVGEREGRKKGLLEGETKGKHEDAMNMLEDEVPIDKICRYTGLAREQVLELAKKKPRPDKVMEPTADYGRPTRRKPNKNPKGRP